VVRQPKIELLAGNKFIKYSGLQGIRDDSRVAAQELFLKELSGQNGVPRSQPGNFLIRRKIHFIPMDRREIRFWQQVSVHFFRCFYTCLAFGRHILGVVKMQLIQVASFVFGEIECRNLVMSLLHRLLVRMRIDSGDCRCAVAGALA